MSSEPPAISVSGLGKCYQIYERPVDRLKQFVYPRLQRRLGRAPTRFFREFWALDDVTFEVGRGESVGIVGRNGSGKSTLLQIVCGTLSPTRGSVETHGRVAALLELGSGFNPEFSGRDNVYLNATLLGLTRQQIDERFESIVAFADIGDHLGQAVKTYSSGMFVRLAFAVIAHVDADILVVDEALSVGDAVFTQRCMRFIRAFQEHGTLLFVSHDSASIQSLCKSAIWLDRGRVREIGPARRVSDAYLRASLQSLYGDGVTLAATVAGPAEVPQPVPQPESPPADPDGARTPRDVVDYGALVRVTPNLPASSGFGTGDAQIEAVTLSVPGAPDSAMLAGGEHVRLVVSVRAVRRLTQPIVGFIVKDRLGQDLFGENTLAAPGPGPGAVDAGERFEGVFEFRLPMLPNGQYAVMASVATGDLVNNIQQHYLHDALILTVSSARIRWGLVGIEFDHVALESADGR